jgi:hypothetical protein
MKNFKETDCRTSTRAGKPRPYECIILKSEFELQTLNLLQLQNLPL